MVQPVRGDADLAKARLAVAERRAIKCSYRNSTGEVSDREIEPIRLESRESSWYVRGFCRSNNEDRIFRLDRMRNIVVLDIFSERIAFSEESEEIYAVRDTDTEVLFEVDPEAFFSNC
jgi:Predicted transcriptional regulator